jgi:chemotaxis protein histidine kinase CheA
MEHGLLITTAIGLMLGTGAFAQSPSDQQKNNPPPAAQSQTNQNSSAPASSSTSSQGSSPSAHNTPSTPSDKTSTTTSQSSPNTADTSSQAQSSQTSASPQAQSTDNAGTAPSQAQSAQQPNAPSQAQTNTAPPANNQTPPSPTAGNANTNTTAQPSTNTNTNTAAQPSNTQSNTAQSSSSNVSVSASLNETQRTRVSQLIARLNVAPLNKVNFSLSVGTVVTRDRFQPLPADVVEILPQYRGYSFFVDRDDIVIVARSSYKIVDALPRTGRSSAGGPAPAPSSNKITFSDKDREIIRKHARSSRVEQRTTGSSTTTTRVRVGERLPESVEIRSFPETGNRLGSVTIATSSATTGHM